MLSTIVNIQPKDTGGGGGETRESIVYRLCDDMLEKLPADYVEHEVRNSSLIQNLCIILFECVRCFEIEGTISQYIVNTSPACNLKSALNEPFTFQR